MHSTKSTRSLASRGERVHPMARFHRTASYLLLLSCLTLVSSGCSLTQGLKNHLAYNDNCNDFVMGWRNSVWARQAWHDQQYLFSDHQEFRAFGAGFRDGYRAVASGGNGCPPPIPPRKYWTWKYQTPEGQCKVAAWFEGYPHGARAAEEDGAGNFQDIQVSYAIEAQYSPEFQTGRSARSAPPAGEGYFVPGQPPDVMPHEPFPGGPPHAVPLIPTEDPGLIPASWSAPASWNIPDSRHDAESQSGRDARNIPATFNAAIPTAAWPPPRTLPQPAPQSTILR